MLRFIAEIFAAWTDLARRGGWFVIAVMLAMTVAAGWYAARNLKVNTDTSEMLDPNLPFQRQAAELRKAFPQIKTDVAVIVKADTLDEAEAFANALRERLEKRSDVVSDLFSPATDPFFQRNGLLYLKTDEVETRLTQLSRAAGLVETMVKSPYADTLFATLADNDALAEKSELAGDSLDKLYNELAQVVDASLKGDARALPWLQTLANDAPGPSGYLRILYVTPKLDFSRLQPAKPAITAIRAEIEELKQSASPRVETYITGDPALRADELSSVTQGIGLSFGVSLAAVGVLLLLCYRNVWMAFVTLVAVVITIAWTAAFAAYAVGQLNLISIAFTVLLTGLGVDFGIHYLLHYQEALDRGETSAAALASASRDTGAGLFLAAATTTLGFISFQWTSFIGIAQLGEIAGFGIAIALFVCVTLCAAAMGVRPDKPRPANKRKPWRATRIIDVVMGPATALTIAATIAALFVVPKAYFDADPMSLRDPESQSVRGFNLLFADANTLPYRLSVLAASEEEARQIEQRAKALPTVGATRSLLDFIPKDQDAKLELIDFASGSLTFAFEAAPDPVAPLIGPGAEALEKRLLAAHADGPARRLGELLKTLREKNDAAARARLQENLFRYWPQLVDRLKAQTAAAPVAEQDLPKTLVERFRAADGRLRVDILPKEDVRDRQALQRFVAEVSTAFPSAAGGAVQNQRAGEIISRSMLQATATALGVITLLLFVIVRRPLLVLLMLAPLLFAAILTIAASVLFDIPFNYANVIVLPLLLGMGIDSGIHMVLRQQQFKEGDVVHDSATSEGVIYAALTTIASFGSLILSSHRGTASMGELLSIALSISLFCTFFTLPAFFRWGERVLRPGAGSRAKS